MNSIDQELIEAAGQNNVPEVERLLSVGADVNARDTGYFGNTPLHVASVLGRVQVVKELVERGADIEANDSGGSTPLHGASCRGHVVVVIELLSRGANIDAKNDVGSTPLHYAANSDQHFPVVKALLNGGANMLAANNQGKLPVHYAVRRRRPAVTKYLLQQLYATTCRLPLHELMQDLTWIGDPYVRVGVPPLRDALDRNVLGTDDVVEILEFLVSQNPALLSSCDQDGSLPLHVACRRGASFTIVQSLVNLYKASVKIVTSDGDLPLFLACEIPEPSLDTIFLLMKLYPDVVYR
jgi:ankyrin repeat protein